MQELAQLMARLRSDDGCPWDRKQSWKSLTPYTIEEAYEVVEAVESGDPSALKDELGFSPAYGMEAGIQHTLDRFAELRPLLRP